MYEEGGMLLDRAVGKDFTGEFTQIELHAFGQTCEIRVFCPSHKGKNVDGTENMVLRQKRKLVYRNYNVADRRYMELCSMLG
jgi:hypothetical protein